MMTTSYKIEDVLKYKNVNIDMPKALLLFHEKQPLIADTRADIVVRNRKKIAQNQMEPVEAIRAGINSALNKLSNDNIKSIRDELLSIKSLLHPEYVTMLSVALIQRASSEKSFIEIYAKMCREISPLKCTDGTLFSKFISNQCRSKFIEYTTMHSVDSDSVELPIITKVERCTVINFIKFLGWMYIYDMLTYNVVDICIERVSENIDKLEYGAEMITSLLEIVSKKYYLICDVEKMSMIKNKLKELINKPTIGKRDKILLELTVEKIT